MRSPKPSPSKNRPSALVVLATLAGSSRTSKARRAFSAAVKRTGMSKHEYKQPERGRGGGRPLKGDGLARLTALQNATGFEEQDGEQVVLWKIKDWPRNFIEWLLAFDPAIEGANVDVLPACHHMPAVTDLVQAPLGQYAFMPNHIKMSDKIRFRLEVEHLVAADRLKFRNLMVLKEADELLGADLEAMHSLLSKAIRSLNKAMWELGYHVRTNSSQRRRNRYTGNDSDVEYVLRRPCWNVNARASARFGKTGLSSSLVRGYGSPSSRVKTAPVKSVVAPVEAQVEPIVTAKAIVQATATVATQTVE